MIGTREPEVLERSVQKTRGWIRDTAAELGTEDLRAAYRALRAVLHTIRDRTPVNEAAEFASQLPELLRGVFYENWVPARVPARYRDRQEFLRRVREAANLAGDTEASYAVTAVMAVVRRRVTEGEVDDVLATMPGEVRALLSGEA